MLSVLLFLCFVSYISSASINGSVLPILQIFLIKFLVLPLLVFAILALLFVIRTSPTTLSVDAEALERDCAPLVSWKQEFKSVSRMLFLDLMLLIFRGRCIVSLFQFVH